MDKRSLSERDICTKFITPELPKAGWDLQSQIREEVTLTKGRVIVRGRAAVRDKNAMATTNPPSINISLTPLLIEILPPPFISWP